MSLSGQAEFHKGKKHAHMQVHLAATIAGRGWGVDSVCFSPDGSLLAIVASDDCVRLWDVSRREVVAALEPAGLGIPSRVSFSPDGKLLAASVGQGIIELWTREGKAVAALGGHVSEATEAAFFPAGTWLVSGDQAGDIHIWDVENRKRVSTFPGAHHRESNGMMLPAVAVDNFAFTSDGRRLAFQSASRHGQIQVWEIDRSEIHPKWVGAVGKPEEVAFDVRFSSDGRTLAVASFDRDVVELFDGQTLASRGTLNIPDDVAKSIAFSPDNHFLAAGGAAGMVWIWEMATRQIVASFAAHTEGPDYRTNSQEWALGDMDWSPDGKLIATSGIAPAIVKLWEVRVEE